MPLGDGNGDRNRRIELTQPGLLDARIVGRASVPTGGRGARKERCEDCFFHQRMLCALEDKKPCPTFRPAHPDGLRPPRQLSFVFRQGRRQDPFQFEPQRG
jgi:hypothetical protein